MENGGMEPDVKKFFIKIINTVSAGVLWLIINATLGIYYQLGFIQQGLTLTNLVFYSWLIVSLLFLIYYFYRLWKNQFH